MYFNWIFTASFITLNKRGVKNVFQLQHRFIKSFVRYLKETFSKNQLT